MFLLELRLGLGYFVNVLP